MSSVTFREAVTNAIRYWEPRRIVYNVLLALIVISYFVYFRKSSPSTKTKISFDGVLGLFLLAVLANAAYCAAYPVDIFAQWSSYREKLPPISLAFVCSWSPIRCPSREILRHSNVLFLLRLTRLSGSPPCFAYYQSSLTAL